MGHEASGVVAEIGAGRHHGEGRPAHRLRGPERLREVRQLPQRLQEHVHGLAPPRHHRRRHLRRVRGAERDPGATRCPDNVDFADAALLEPLSLTVRSLEHVKPFVGESAVIIGPGTVGLLHLQALRAAGRDDAHRHRPRGGQAAVRDRREAGRHAHRQRQRRESRSTR
ncbi:MAG: hypothetical protein MZV63_60155 [Marinilabiliales bacterium]|nr:hypothetical protein [Marinilabiliales bacterium]